MPETERLELVESVLVQAKELSSQKRGNELTVLNFLRQFESKNRDGALPQEFHLAAFSAAYICCSRAINFFHNPHDALFNGLYALLHLEPAAPQSDKRFKLYRMIADAYSRFGRYETALAWCGKAASALTSDAAGEKYFPMVEYTRFSILLKNGKYNDAEAVISGLKEKGEKIGSFLKLRGEHDLFIRNQPESARIYFELAGKCEEYLDDLSIKLSLASVLVFEGKLTESLALFERSAMEYEKLDERKRNPWHYLFFGKALKTMDPSKAILQFKKAVDLLNGGAEQGADILGRAAFMEEHPGLYEDIFSELLEINVDTAWETLQYIKNYYLVLELTHEGYTHKIWNLLKHNPSDKISHELSLEILDYSYKNFEQVNPNLRTFQTGLADDDVILDYHCRKDDSVCFVIRKSRLDVKIIRAGDLKISELSKEGNALLGEALNTLTLAPATDCDPGELKIFARQTGLLLLPPGLAGLHVTLVPDRALFHLPFQILIAPGTADPLGKVSIITMASNATLLVNRVARKNSKKIVFLHDKDMMFAGRELADLQKRWNVEVVEEIVKLNSLAEESGIIHFAGHFAFEEKISLSWFDLGNGKKLRLKDLMEMRLLGADVVLNVCESGKHTEYGTGTEYFDAARFFIRAGARQVITTTMPVSEGTAYLFSMELYNRLVDSDPAEALNQILKANPAFAEICPYVVRV